MECMKIGCVPKLLSFLAKVVPFFSCSHHHQKLLVLFPKFTYDVKPSFIWVIFLALSFLIVTIFSGSSSKPSTDCEDSHNHSISFLSILELYPLSYQVDEEILDMGTYSFTNIVNKDDQDSIPRVACLELEGATGSHEVGKEFIPKVVHLELIEGAIGSHEDYYKDFIPRLVHVEVIEGSIGSDAESKDFHGCDGYDEDNDDEGEEDDVDGTENDGDAHDDLRIRIEEFIAKNIRKWKEEMLNDNFPNYIEY